MNTVQENLSVDKKNGLSMAYEMVNGNPTPGEIVIFSAEMIFGAARGTIYSFSPIREAYQDSPRVNVIPMRMYPCNVPKGAFWDNRLGEWRVRYFRHDDVNPTVSEYAITAAGIMEELGRRTNDGFAHLPERRAYELTGQHSALITS